MKVVKTPQFDADQLHIEDHIFESNGNEIKFVERFIDELDSAVQWVSSNAATPKEDEMGDRSWPFYRDRRGLFRYRLNLPAARPRGFKGASRELFLGEKAQLAQPSVPPSPHAV